MGDLNVEGHNGAKEVGDLYNLKNLINSLHVFKILIFQQV